MIELRSEETAKKYDDYLQETPLAIACPLCGAAAIEEFKYWKIVENKFPYDLIAERHHMIVPIRHSVESELNDDELKELIEIKTDLIERDYDYILEATKRMKSIPDHFHQHLLEWKK